MFLGTNIEQRNITARLKTGQKRDRCVTQIPDYRQQMKTQIPVTAFHRQDKGVNKKTKKRCNIAFLVYLRKEWKLLKQPI